MVSYDRIKELAQEVGFSLCGIAPARVLSEQQPRLTDWLEKGFDSGMEYIGRYADKRIDPAALVEGAKTVIVCAVNYKNDAWDQSVRVKSPKIASYSYAVDYHKTIKKMLTNILKQLSEAHPNICGRCFTDTAPILEKAWAVEAGLGWIGKNSLLITPQYGSFILMGEIIIDHTCDKYDLPFDKQQCGNCTACLEACPSKAIVSPRIIDTSKCISRLTTQPTPEGFNVSKQNLHGWLFGCDQCQSCCPHNSRTPYFSNNLFAPVIPHKKTTPEFWNSITQEQLCDIFSRTPLKRFLDKILSKI